MSEIYRQTLHCRNKDCLAKVRVGRILSYPYMKIGSFGFCPLCGSSVAVETNNEESYWETIADNWNMSVELLKEIYNVWDRNEYQNLGDFIRKLREDAKKVKVPA